MAITKTFAFYEDADGVEHGPFRVGIATKLQYEKTAAARKWDTEKQPFTTSLFWAWHASKLAGEHNLSWEDFRDTVADAVVENPDEKGEDSTEDPTQPEA